MADKTVPDLTIEQEFGEHQCSVCGTDCGYVAERIEDLNKKNAELRDALGRVRFGVMLMVPEPQKTGFLEIIDVALGIKP